MPMMAACSQKSSKPAKENKNSKKKSTTWDPSIFGSNGNGPSKEEMMKLDRSQKPSDDSKDEEVDHQFDQYVPDASVIGTSRGKILIIYILIN